VKTGDEIKTHHIKHSRSTQEEKRGKKKPGGKKGGGGGPNRFPSPKLN
jgi:hypothetical protein